MHIWGHHLLLKHRLKIKKRTALGGKNINKPLKWMALGPWKKWGRNLNNQMDTSMFWFQAYKFHDVCSEGSPAITATQATKELSYLTVIRGFYLELVLQ